MTSPGRSQPTGVGELGRLISLHMPRTRPAGTLDVFERQTVVEPGAGFVRFAIPGFKALGCAECHDGDVLLQNAAKRMRGVLTALRARFPGLSNIPFRQYIIQSWSDPVLSPPQLAHTTFDTIRIFPSTILIDGRVYRNATHLHESLHLTQFFLGAANELEAYGLNIRSDPRFLFLNFPYFEDVVTVFYLPEFHRYLDAFFARPVREGSPVPREVQWFMMDFDAEVLDRVAKGVKSLAPLLEEVSRLNREYPLESAYWSEQMGNPSFLLELVAVRLHPLPSVSVQDEMRDRAFAILKDQLGRTDNVRLGYRINRKKEALLFLEHKLKIREASERTALYFHFLKQRFITPEGKVRLTPADREVFQQYVKNKIEGIDKILRFEGLTGLEREAGEKLLESLKKAIPASSP